MMELKKILVVDDDADQLEQLEVQLQAAGFDVVTADGYATGIEAFTVEQPDLVILDLMMEEPDAGFRLSYEIKKVTPEVPVIIVSAVTSRTGLEFDAVTDEERAWIKADAFLTKPIRFEQLRREIDRLAKAA